MISSRVLQFPVRVRVIALVAFAIAAMVSLSAGALQASAESSILDNPEANVFLRYGVSPGLATEGYQGYSYDEQIYSKGAFRDIEQAHAREYGWLSLTFSKRKKVTGVHLTLIEGEKLVGITTDYKLANGRERYIPWTGEGILPVYKQIGSQRAKLIYTGVAIHTPKLPNQPKEPEYEGMH